MSAPTYEEIFERANQLAGERYPSGCASAGMLANLVRDAIHELAEEREWALVKYNAALAETRAITEEAQQIRGRG